MIIDRQSAFAQQMAINCRIRNALAAGGLRGWWVSKTFCWQIGPVAVLKYVDRLTVRVGHQPRDLWTI